MSVRPPQERKKRFDTPASRLKIDPPTMADVQSPVCIAEYARCSAYIELEQAVSSVIEGPLNLKR